MNKLGVPFIPALALGFVVTAAVSVVFERLLYSRLYRAPELDQVLFTIGLVFIMIAAVTLLVGPETQPLTLPPLDAGPDRSRLHDLSHLQHRADRGRHRHHARRSGSASSAPAWARRSAPRSTTAAWRNRSASTSTRLFTITFAFGSGMAALGGGLGAEFLGLDPQYPLKYLVMFLIVVAVGGLGRITGVFYAALIIGVRRLHAEEIRAAGRHGVHLRADHPAAAVAAAGPVRDGRHERDAPTSGDNIRGARARPAPSLPAGGSRCRGCWRWRSISPSRAISASAPNF